MTALEGEEFDAFFRVDLPPRPYPGLRPFEKEEWPIFFGRERMADAVVAQLTGKRLLVVHGDSGCGKSSLARAGVLPRLEQENARGGIRWRTCVAVPRDAPLLNLAEALAGIDGGPVDDERVIEIRRVFNFGRDAFEMLGGLLRRNSSDHVCVMIDQFEELFNHARRRGPDEARLLTETLAAFFAAPPEGLYVILTMRSEFLGACARFSGFAETVNASQYLLPRMEHGDLLRAIHEPAALYDGDVSRELAERLIADAGGGQDQLPLVQHGLMQLWWSKVQADNASNGAWRLGLEDYQGTGGLAALLSDHADQVMTQAAPDAKRQNIVEHLFRALTDINAEGSAVRRPESLGQLVAITGSDEQTLKEIIDHFRAEGVSFLTPYGDAPIESGKLIDISHEALIRCWKRIADPLEGWLKREFKDGLLWQSLRLQADKFAKNRDQILAAAETTYNERWLTTIPSPAWTDRYKDCWTGVERLMQASGNARARQMRKDAWVQRGLVAALAIFSLLTAFAGWSWWQTSEALAERMEAEKRAQVGESFFRAEQSRNERRNGSPVNAMLLALAGLPESLGEQGGRPWVGEAAGALVEAVAEQRERLFLPSDDEGVLAAAFSPDGHRVVSGSWDGTVRVWDAVSGREHWALKSNAGPVNAVAFSHDGSSIVTGSGDDTVRTWDAAGGQQLSIFSGHTGDVLSAVFSPDGERIASGSADGNVRIWDAGSGASVLELPGHQGAVWTVAFAPDGNRIVSGSADRTVRVWEAPTWKDFLILRGHESRVRAAEFSPDGARIVSGSDDNTVRLWDAGSLKDLSVLQGHEDRVRAAAFSPDGSLIVSGSWDDTVRVWDAASGNERWALYGHNGDVLTTAFSPDGGRIVSGSKDNSVRVWDVASGEAYDLKGHQGWVNAVAYSSDGSRIVSGSADGTVRVWTPSSVEKPLLLPGHNGDVLAAAFSPDGRRIVSGSADYKVRVWDATTGKRLLTLDDHEGPVNAVAYSPDDARIVSGSADDTVRVWDATTGNPILVLRGHDGDVLTAAFSPDGGLIVSGSEDETARVWDAASGAELLVLRGHEGAVWSAAFSLKDHRIVSGSEDNTVRVTWVPRSQQNLIDTARTNLPREFTDEQRQRFYLTVE